MLDHTVHYILGAKLLCFSNFSIRCNVNFLAQIDLVLVFFVREVHMNDLKGYLWSTKAKPFILYILNCTRKRRKRVVLFLYRASQMETMQSLLIFSSVTLCLISCQDLKWKPSIGTEQIRLQSSQCLRKISPPP